MKILVFGATSTIAMEALKLFAADGAEFFLVARDANKLKVIQNDLIVRQAGRVDCVATDITRTEEHESIIQKAKDALGSIDAVLIAYGTLGDQKACQESYKLTEKEIQANFLSVVSILTPLAGYFEQRKRGVIAVVSSVAGDRGRQSNYVYGAAKGALSLFLQGLRQRLYPHGVSVITIKPGFVDTPMTKGFKKGALFVGPAVVGLGIYNAILKKKGIVYLPWFWCWIMLVIKHIPETVFKRLKL